jgi:hypothetical protein
VLSNAKKKIAIFLLCIDPPQRLIPPVVPVASLRNRCKLLRGRIPSIHDSTTGLLTSMLCGARKAALDAVLEGLYTLEELAASISIAGGHWALVAPDRMVVAEASEHECRAGTK